MGASSDFIRNAVLQSLRNDEKLCTEVDSTDAQQNEGAKADGKQKADAASTPKSVKTAKTDGNETDERKDKVKGKKRKRGNNNLDSNWKALQKVIVPQGMKKRPRRMNESYPKKQSNINNTENNLKALSSNEKKSTQHESDSSMFSAFMSRAVRMQHTQETSIVALDCEMVGVGPDGRQDALARVSVVNYVGDVLYDTFVKAGEPVTDYRTKFSGVRESDIGPGSKAVEAFEAQRIVGELLRNKIVVGHSIKNDFRVLRIAHPWNRVRDTSEYFKKLWKRRGKPALRALVAQVLGVDTFQKDEHDSCEDARAALALYKHELKNWERRVREGGGVLKKKLLTAPSKKKK